MTKYKQDPPFCIQVEMTEGCSIQCDFCGIQGIRKKPGGYKFLSYDLCIRMVNRIAQAIAQHGWNPRIEFAMHGEPTMNPRMVAIVKLFRRFLPKIHLMMLTNGTGLIKNPTKTILELFDAGLNTLAVENYEHTDLVFRIERGLAPFMLPNNKIDEMYYPHNGPDANPHKRWPHKRFIIVSSIDLETKGTHSTLNNHCGCAAPLDHTFQEKCAKPFRELSIRWDGQVALCCNDWRGVYNCGSVIGLSLDEIWNGLAFDAARRMLYQGKRTFPPCTGCTQRSYRVGLLPDKLGKKEMPRPTKKTDGMLSVATSIGPMTKPVLRKWEK